MKNLLKTFVLVIISSIMLVNTSCITEEDDERTEQQELQELNELISSLISEGFDIDTTAMGVYYITHVEGEGPLVQPYDTIDIAYEGYLTDGFLFDSTDSWEFIYKQQSLIPGFDDGLALMNKNCEIELIIPSSLAYGAYGSPPSIPPFSTLIFGVKMNDIKPVSE